jgi:hypothetical protein
MDGAETTRMAANRSSRRARWWAAGAALIAAAPCGAQSADTDPFYWPYAAAFGSGVYRLSDDLETQTYRGNFSIKLREAGDKAGLRLLLPVAIGVEDRDGDFRPLDRGADNLQHAAFMPGIEMEHRPGERWTLRTRAQLGYGEEHAGTEQSARLAAVGLRGRIAFDDAPGKPALIGGVLWTGFDPSAGERRSLLRFTLGTELDIRAARWRVRDSPMRWRPHVLKDWFHRPPPALAFGDDDFAQLEDEWQLGVAAAREDEFKILFFKFDAVGVAYRFSEHSEGLRFYVNSVF